MILAFLIAAIIPLDTAPPRFDYFESNTVCSWECGEDGIYFQRFTFCQLLCRNYKEHLGEHVIDHWVMQGTDPAKMKADPVFIHSRGVWQFRDGETVIEASGYYETAADFDIEVAERELWAKEKRCGLSELRAGKTVRK